MIYTRSDVTTAEQKIREPLSKRRYHVWLFGLLIGLSLPGNAALSYTNGSGEAGVTETS